MDWLSVAGAAGEIAAKCHIPFRTYLLLVVSTREWCPDRGLDPRIVHSLEELRARGWMVRTTGPRNYILWRQGRVLTDSRLAILVLPDSSVAISTFERNLIIMFEVLKAASRIYSRAIHDRPGVINIIKFRSFEFLSGKTKNNPVEILNIFGRIENKITFLTRI